DLNATPIKENGKIVGVQGIARDITKRKQLENEIKSLKEFNENIIESMNLGLVVVDRDLRVLKINKYEKSHFKITDEIIGKNILKFSPVLEKEGFGEWLTRVIETGESLEIKNWEHETLKLGKRYINLRIDPLKDKDGEVIGSTILAEDITEKKKLEKEIYETKNYLASIVTNSADAIIATDLEGKVVSWNKAAERIYGWTEQEVIGKIVPTVPSPELEEILKKARKREVIIDYETERVHKDGSKIMVTSTISPILDCTGKVIGASGITRDITEKKKLELTQKMLHEASMNLVKQVDLKELCDYTLNACLALTNSEFGYLAIANKDGSFTKISLQGMTLEEGNIIDIREICDDAINTGKPCICNESCTGPHIIGISEGHKPINNFLAIPVMSNKDIIGMIGIANKKGGYNIEDQNILTTFANNVSILIERKKAEENIRYLKEYNEKIINGIKELIIVINPNNYKIISANDNTLESTGLGKEDVIGRPCYEVLLGRSRPCSFDYICPLEETLQTGEYASTERVIDFDDEQKGMQYIEISTYPIKNENNSINKVIHVVRDLTEKKKLEMQLIQSEKMASIGDFSAGVAHNLRSPLSVIKGFPE
ncbi:MAG: PAS domain S-box protein, partial [Methanosarcinales archaeon]